VALAELSIETYTATAAARFDDGSSNWHSGFPRPLVVACSFATAPPNAADTTVALMILQCGVPTAVTPSAPLVPLPDDGAAEPRRDGRGVGVVEPAAFELADLELADPRLETSLLDRAGAAVEDAAVAWSAGDEPDVQPARRAPPVTTATVVRAHARQRLITIVKSPDCSSACSKTDRG
jgi:hypothetical protein